MKKPDKAEQNSVKEIHPKLDDLSGSIIKSIADTESPFLELGQSLQEIYSESDDLIKKITVTAERFNVASEQSIVQVIERSIKAVLSELSGYPEKIRSKLGHISESGQYLKDLGKLCTRFNNASRFLNVVGLNFGIEGCRSKEATDLFDGFAEEIKDLALNINELAEKMHVDTIQALSGQKPGLSGINGKIEEIENLTGEARDAVLKTMENIQRLADMSCHTLEKAQHTAQAIREMVGEIAMAIQFHDIARQQLEHVTQAFEDVSQWLKENTESGVSAQKKSAVKIPSQIVSILKVQYEQLIHVTKEINRAYEKIMTSFLNINKEVNDLKHLLSESRSQDQTLSLETEFETITNRMENLKQIQDQGRNLSNEMGKTIQESSDVVATLSQYAGQINTINTGLKYKALNAIIMTAKLGEKGHTLEILAREVRNISVDCTGLVKTALKYLTSISEIADLLETGRGEKNNGQSALSFEGIQLNTVIQEISDTLDAQKQESDHAVQAACDLEEKIETTGNGLSFLNTWFERLTRESESLDEMINLLQPFVDMDCENDSDRIENLTRRYTMESERIIHSRISGDLSESLAEDNDSEKDVAQEYPDTETGEPERDKKPEKDKKKEEFDDNIELF